MSTLSSSKTSWMFFNFKNDAPTLSASLLLLQYRLVMGILSINIDTYRYFRYRKYRYKKKIIEKRNVMKK